MLPGDGSPELGQKAWDSQGEVRTTVLPSPKQRDPATPAASSVRALQLMFVPNLLEAVPVHLHVWGCFLQVEPLRLSDPRCRGWCLGAEDLRESTQRRADLRASNS